MKDSLQKGVPPNDGQRPILQRIVQSVRSKLRQITAPEPAAPVLGPKVVVSTPRTPVEETGAAQVKQVVDVRFRDADEIIVINPHRPL